MTRPAENQQTVEAALNYGDVSDIWGVRRNDAARVALRDLVAQAELAAELGKALRRRYEGDQELDADGCDCIWCDEDAALLARLDGAR